MKIEKEIQDIAETSIKDLIDRIGELERIVENIQDLYASQNVEIDKEPIKPIASE